MSAMAASGNSICAAMVMRLLSAERVHATPVAFRPSEHQLQGQLRRARAADLIQRIEAAILAATSERGSRQLRRLPAQRGTHVVDWAAEIGVVEDVEKIRACLKGKPLPELELSPQRQTCVAPNPRRAFRPRSPCTDWQPTGSLERAGCGDGS